MSDGACRKNAERGIKENKATEGGYWAVLNNTVNLYQLQRCTQCLTLCFDLSD